MGTNSRFAYAPTVSIGRSKFGRSFSHKTTINTGDLVPIYWDDILPGDTVVLDVKALVRSLTVQAPVMDNAFITVEAYFVPNRTIWNHWVNFCGENDSEAWTDSTEYSIPKAGSGADIEVGSIGDYLGLPPGMTTGEEADVSELPLRAYAKIWNEFWRDENYQDPILFSVSDTSSSAIKYNDLPLKANKFHDYFTSVLPSPQKGDPVVLGLGDTADVSGTANFTALNFSSAALGSPKLNWPNGPAGSIGGSVSIGQVAGTRENNPLQTTYDSGQSVQSATALVSTGGSFNSGAVTSVSGLTADLSSATAVSVNDLRLAFAVQKMLEANSRYGTRYVEMLAGHFGIQAPDAVLQNAQYLGGKRVPLNMETVVSNSSSEGGSKLGDMAGYSKTFGDSGRIVQSFTEHGIIMVLATIRTSHTYSQGVPHKFLRSSIYDFYDPKLANIGEQAVKAIEINFMAGKDVVFGYQEAWAPERYNPNVLSGLLRPYVTGGLGMWTYGDDFDDSLSVATPDFMKETKDNVARTLASQDTFQWICDFYFDLEMVRPMPMYSIPGLIDHH